MSAANFTTRLCGFPLYARKDAEAKFCPCCRLWNEPDAAECDECGENLQDVSPEYDPFTNDEIASDVSSAAEDLNRDLRFFRVSVASGYYTGLQLVVDMPQDDPEDLDNDDCHYYYDDCRSRAIRACSSERRRLEKSLAALAQHYGFDRYGVAARFSNGEVWYQKY